MPELKLEEDVTAIRTGITNATGPIVLSATLCRGYSKLSEIMYTAQYTLVPIN